jgi:transcriptional repressor NrdR
MKCPFCSHHETQVIDSRTPDEGDVIRRRRQCVACQKRFTTYERTELTMPAVVKKNGARVDYKRSKLLSSFQLAMRKRPVSSEKLDQAIARIEVHLLMLAQRGTRSG